MTKNFVCLRQAILVLAWLISTQIQAASFKRIVSATLTADEILWALTPPNERGILLSLSPLAKDRRYSNIALESNLPQTDFGPNLERLVQAKPDLVFISAFNKQSYLNMLKKFQINYIPIPDLVSIDGVLACIEAMGEKLGREKAAKSLQADLRLRLKKLSVPQKKKRVLSYSESNILAGSDSLYHDVLLHAHADNVVAEAGIKTWQKVSAEIIAKSRPDVVIAPANADHTPQITLHDLRSAPGWNQLDAVKEGRVVWIDSALLSSASQFTVQAVESIHQALYGESK